ncbi:MAG: serine hydrolase [Pseudomonadota bacterium]
MSCHSLFRACAIVCLVVWHSFLYSAFAEAPFIDQDDDRKFLGSPETMLTWEPEQQVAGYRNADKIFWTRVIEASGDSRVLPYARIDLSDQLVRVGDQAITVDSYFREHSVAGLLVIKDGAIVYERYGLGNDEHSRWASYSVAKSVVSMLIGAAIEDGFIASVDDKVTRYLPRLKGSAYDQTSIADLLQMSSGVEWNENYADATSDVATAPWDTLGLQTYLMTKRRVADAGNRFNYNTAESNLTGTLLRAAIGNNLSTYLSEKIWQPFGMESDALWTLTEPGGGEFGGCCINATLRDYGRIGLFALANGRLTNGQSVLPKGWIDESVRPSKSNPQYGYLWWLKDDGAYGAEGIFGQAIYIDPNQDVVIALHSARPNASRASDWIWQDALFATLTRAVAD